MQKRRKWNSIKHEHPQSKPVSRERARFNPIMINQSNDVIRIPLPNYQYGATRRQRFAFGQVNALQARKNTAEQLRYYQQPAIPVPEVTPQTLGLSMVNSPNLSEQVASDSVGAVEEDSEMIERSDPSFNFEESSAIGAQEFEIYDDDPFQQDEEPTRQDCA